jgi:hypothetical protein
MQKNFSFHLGGLVIVMERTQKTAFRVGIFIVPTEKLSPKVSLFKLLPHLRESEIVTRKKSCIYKVKSGQFVIDREALNSGSVWSIANVESAKNLLAVTEIGAVFDANNHRIDDFTVAFTSGEILPANLCPEDLSSVKNLEPMCFVNFDFAWDVWALDNGDIVAVTALH